MKATCPKCSRPLPVDDVNVGADTALCRKCNEVFALSDLVDESGDERDFNLNVPPRGAWYRDNGEDVRIGATTRSAAAFFIVPFMCVWSGGSLGGIYGGQILSGRFSLGLSLFGIPFVLGTLLFGTIAAMTAAGKVEVRLRGETGEIFTGIGRLGWRRRFARTDVTQVYEGVSSVRGAGSSGACITLEGQRRINFGSGLSAERRYFVLRALRQTLQPARHMRRA